MTGEGNQTTLAWAATLELRLSLGVRAKYMRYFTYGCATLVGVLGRPCGSTEGTKQGRASTTHKWERQLWILNPKQKVATR